MSLLNRYFANIGPTLAASINHSGKDFNSYLKNSHISATCFLQPTDREEFFKLLGNWVVVKAQDMTVYCENGCAWNFISFNDFT